MSNICKSIWTLKKKKEKTHTDSKDFCYNAWNLKYGILVE